MDTPPGREELGADLKSRGPFIVRRALRADLDAGKPPRQACPYRVRWIFLGGEVVVDYPLRLIRLRKRLNDPAIPFDPAFR